jgi:hypothetical protein
MQSAEITPLRGQNSPFRLWEEFDFMYSLAKERIAHWKTELCDKVEPIQRISSFEFEVHCSTSEVRFLTRTRGFSLERR